MRVWRELSVAGVEGEAQSTAGVLALRRFEAGTLGEVGDVGIVEATLSGGGGRTSRVDASRTAPWCA